MERLFDLPSTPDYFDGGDAFVEAELPPIVRRFLGARDGGGFGFGFRDIEFLNGSVHYTGEAPEVAVSARDHFGSWPLRLALLVLGRKGEIRPTAVGTQADTSQAPRSNPFARPSA